MAVINKSLNISNFELERKEKNKIIFKQTKRIHLIFDILSKFFQSTVSICLTFHRRLHTFFIFQFITDWSHLSFNKSTSILKLGFD